MVTIRNMTKDQRTTESRVVEIDQMTLLLTLQGETIEIKQKNAEKIRILRQECRDIVCGSVILSTKDYEKLK